MCKNILQLDNDDIKLIKKYGYGRDNAFINPNVKDIEQLRDNNKTVPGLCRELIQWDHYTHAYSTITIVIINNWPEKGNINPIHVAVQDVQTTNFLKYAKLHLIDKNSILSFYSIGIINL